MKKVLVTGGTIFVSRYIAEYYVAKGYEVYVLNRNSREQSKGVKLIQAEALLRRSPNAYILRPPYLYGR